MAYRLTDEATDRTLGTNFGLYLSTINKFCKSELGRNDPSSDMSSLPRQLEHYYQ